MENKMENEMETGTICGIIGDYSLNSFFILCFSVRNRSSRNSSQYLIRARLTAPPSCHHPSEGGDPKPSGRWRMSALDKDIIPILQNPKP